MTLRGQKRLSYRAFKESSDIDFHTKFLFAPTAPASAVPRFSFFTLLMVDSSKLRHHRSAEANFMSQKSPTFADEEVREEQNCSCLGFLHRRRQHLHLRNAKRVEYDKRIQVIFWNGSHVLEGSLVKNVCESESVTSGADRVLRQADWHSGVSFADSCRGQGVLPLRVAWPLPSVAPVAQLGSGLCADVRVDPGPSGLVPCQGPIGGADLPGQCHPNQHLPLRCAKKVRL